MGNKATSQQQTSTTVTADSFNKTYNDVTTLGDNGIVLRGASFRDVVSEGATNIQDSSFNYSDLKGASIGATTIQSGGEGNAVTGAGTGLADLLNPKTLMLAAGAALLFLFTRRK